MKKDNTDLFFKYLWEIRRDITAIEFFMRCAIAKKDGEIDKFPKAPYIKNKLYNEYPDSFWHFSFEIITQKFNNRFPKLQIPKEIVELRDAMAHWIIAEIDNSNINQLIKFKENRNNKNLKVEFSLTLELARLAQINQSLKELRRYIAKEIN